MALQEVTRTTGDQEHEREFVDSNKVNKEEEEEEEEEVNAGF